jgi:hypothetical protein
MERGLSRRGVRAQGATMSAAALTPRVRTIVVCDEATASEIEEGVFNLEGVRQGVRAESFPRVRGLAVYLLLSYPRRGSFDGQVKLVDEEEDKAIRYAKFSAEFEDPSGLVAVAVAMDNCVFPGPGVYTIQVEFWTKAGDVQKGEQPFHVWHVEE